MRENGKNDDIKETGLEVFFGDNSIESLSLLPKEILDSLPYMIWAKDTDGRFRFVNKVFADACGRNQECRKPRQKVRQFSLKNSEAGWKRKRSYMIMKL